MKILISNNRIDFINNLQKEYYIDVNKSYLNRLIKQSYKKFKRKGDLCRFLNTDCGTIKRWIGEYDKKTAIKFYQYKKLISLLGIKRNRALNDIKGFKTNKGGRFIKLKFIKINLHLSRLIGFILGDGSVGKRSIRMSNTEISIIQYTLKYLSILGLDYLIKLMLVIPKNYSDKQLEKSKNKWYGILKRKINYVYRKHDSKINNKESVFKKEYIELSVESSSLARIFKKLIPKIKEYILKDIRLQKAYLQGIYAAEGSITSSDKNRLRQIFILMKNEKEIEYIQKLLDNLGIFNSGVKKYKKENVWYISITNYHNLKKLKSMDLFLIHESKKKKLIKILDNYQRTQTISKNREFRYHQIKSLIQKHKKLSSIELTKKLDTSLCRTQVLLRDGWINHLWSRKWNGNEFIYFLKE